MRAMLLAAGRGERLRPLTDSVPKPLIEIGGKPLIIRHLEALAAAGFGEVVINLAWLGGRIERTLGDGRAFGLTITYSREPEGALETAGGIRHALDLLGEDPFAVISSDVITDFPVERLRACRLEALAHLVMVDNPPHHPEGDFHLDGNILRTHGGPKLTYSGLGVFHPKLFAPLEPGVRPLRPVLEKAMSHKQVTGERHAGQWLDIGSPERLARAEELLQSTWHPA